MRIGTKESVSIPMMGKNRLDRGPLVTACERRPLLLLGVIFMPKTLKGIFDEICSIENIEQAYYMARRDKRYRKEILLFSANLLDNLYKIHNKLLQEDFAPEPFHEVVIHDPKTRLIMVQPFEDRVIHWAFYRIINPFLVKGYITDSYACIEDRGQIAAVECLQSWMYGCMHAGTGEWYYLKTDISKYFYRIPHDKLIAEFNRKISDKRVQAWFAAQLQQTNKKFGLPLGVEATEIAPKDRLADRGVATGTLGAQMSGNLYLNPLDQYVKRELGVKYYIRYNDDIIILHNNKKELANIRTAIKSFVTEQLNLEINPKKTAIRPIHSGVEFCGRKIYATHYRLRKSTSLRMKRNLKGIMMRYRYRDLTFEQAAQRVNSYQALLDRGYNERLRESIFGDKNGRGGWFVLTRE